MPNAVKPSSWPLLLVCLVSLLAGTLGGCNKSANSKAPPQKQEQAGQGKKNYAKNGHAELGMKYWGFQGTAHISISDTAAHSGLYSVYVGNRSESWHGVTYKFEDVRPNRAYEISAWVKLAPGEPDSEVTITARFQGHQPIYRNLVSATANAQKWTQIKGKFDHPNTLLDYVYIESPNPTLSYYVDDIALEGTMSDSNDDKTSFNKGQARFNYFEYEGSDKLFQTAPKQGQFRNPVLSGFRGEPSIARVGEDYYLVHSSYVGWPGIPIYHSKDLVNWQQIGHVVSHHKQFEFKERQMSEGIVAPSIRYHEGKFYIIATAIWSGGHFLMTANDPSGPWSSPLFFSDLKGIDPDLFFDDNGKVYIVHNDRPDTAPFYSGHRAIWLHEYDIANHKIKPYNSKLLVNGGVDITTRPVWVQGPHLFKKDGWYYLSCSQGGNGFALSQVIFRSKSLGEPFEPGPNNPILTQYGLPDERPDPVIATGQADLIVTQNGDWWAVFMGSRAYDAIFNNLGREIFLLPVTWQDGWPSILEAGQNVPYLVDLPLPSAPHTGDNQLTSNFLWRDEFESQHLALEWQSLRAEYSDWLTIDTINQQLIINSEKDTLSSLGTPAFVSRLVQNHRYRAKTELILPLSEGISAGVAIFQNSRYHYYLGAKKTPNGYSLFVEMASGGDPELVNSIDIVGTPESIVLGVEGNTRDMNFFYQEKGKDVQYLVKNANAKALSASYSAEEVGNRIGPYVRGY